MTRAVRFDSYGGPEVLYVAEVEVPTPAAGQVRVEVRAAGINPGEAAIRVGALDEQWPATFPSGQGSDLAGVIESVFDEDAGWAAGDEVIGWTDRRASQAELAIVDADKLARKPAGVSWEAAGALFVVGTTAFAAVGADGHHRGCIRRRRGCRFRNRAAGCSRGCHRHRAGERCQPRMAPRSRGDRGGLWGWRRATNPARGS